jgi:hypothetical protein
VFQEYISQQEDAKTKIGIRKNSLVNEKGRDISTKNPKGKENFSFAPIISM